jgi:hypothetical protein
LQKKLFLLLLLGFPLVIFAAAFGRAVNLARQGPVPEALRDLNCDGRVSAIEWLRAGLDYDLRDAGEGCTAVYFVKTGTAVVYRCKTEPLCRTARQWKAAHATLQDR